MSTNKSLNCNPIYIIVFLLFFFETKEIETKEIETKEIETKEIETKEIEIKERV